MEKPLVGDREAQEKVNLINFNYIKLPKDNEQILNGETLFQETLEEYSSNLPTLTTGENPITIRNIANHQARDSPLQMDCRDGNQYNHREMHNMDVACFTTNLGQQWKILLPTPLLMKYSSGIT